MVNPVFVGFSCGFTNMGLAICAFHGDFPHMFLQVLLQVYGRVLIVNVRI
jgi:hypothetical protein